MGTPDFAVPTLQAIANSRHEVVGVVSQPDRPRGRGRRLQPTPVKAAAEKLGIAPVLQPESLKEPGFISDLAALEADAFVVVAFRILPEVIFTMPRKGTLNLHPSLLPELRGAAPINWAVIRGHTRTGLTTILIQKEIDAGNIVLQEPRPIFPDDTAGTLHDRLAPDGAELVVRSLELIATGNARPMVQDPARVTSAPRLHKDDCRLSFDQPAERVRDWIRGLSPFPGAFAFLGDRTVKLYRARVVSGQTIHPVPGTVLRAAGEDLWVACNPGTLALTELKMEGRKAMAAGDFLRGNALEPGDRFS